MSNSLMAIKASGDAATAEQKRTQERKRNILVLINHYLVENGYTEAAERLQHETSGAVSKFSAADNVDLSLILSEFESYYEMKFDKKPKLVRKLDDDEMAKLSKSSLSKKTSVSKTEKKSDGNADTSKLPNIVTTAEPMQISGTSVAATSQPAESRKKSDEFVKIEDRFIYAHEYYFSVFANLDFVARNSLFLKEC
jgi:hypothetical protein